MSRRRAPTEAENTGLKLTYLKGNELFQDFTPEQLEPFHHTIRMATCPGWPRSRAAADRQYRGRRGGTRVEAHVADVDSVLAASREAVQRLIATAASTGPAWATPPAPGKWSPSQIVEHVARSFDASTDAAASRPTAFPRLPAILHPVLRVVLRRMLKRGVLPNGKTTKAMNPIDGPATPAAGRARLEAAHERYETACRELAARGAPMRTTMFGPVPVEDFIRFMELHTRHHHQQIGAKRGDQQSVAIATQA